MPPEITPKLLWERRKSILPAILVVIGASYAVGTTSAKAIDAYNMAYTDHARIDAFDVKETRLEQKIDDIRDFLRVPRRPNYAGE